MRFLLTLIAFFMVICFAQSPTLEYEVVTRLELVPVDSIRWSPDGTKLAVLMFPDIQIWDAANWELLLTIPEANATAAEWSPTGDMLAGVGSAGSERLMIWDAATGEMLQEMTREIPSDTATETIFIHDLAWHPDGSKIATSSGLREDVVLIWDFESDDNPHILVSASPAGYDYTVARDLEWSHDGEWLLVAGFDELVDDIPKIDDIIRLYDATTGETLTTIPAAYHPIWSSDNQQFASMNLVDGIYTLNIWQAETGDTLTTFEAYESRNALISWNYEANLIAGVRNEGEMEQANLLVWDVETGTRHEIPELFYPSVTGIEWQPNGNQLAISDFYDGIVILNFTVDD